MITHAVASGDAINTGVRLGEFSGDSAVSFGARPEQEFAGVATLCESFGARSRLPFVDSVRPLFGSIMFA